MTTINWGLLSKSAVDAETIEEAIARLIQAHDDDETSHLDTGQALQSHKASEIIDHLASSIIADKISNREITPEKLYDLSTIRHSFGFESLDGWEILGSAVIVSGGVLRIAAMVGDPQYVYATAPSGFPLTWNAKFSGSFFLKITNILYNKHHLVIGSKNVESAEDQAVGFYIAEGVLYAYTIAMINDVQVETTTLINGITLTNINFLRVEFLPAEAVKFYVNDILVATHTTNLPAGVFYTSHLFTFMTNFDHVPGYNSQVRIQHPYLSIDR